MRALAGSLTLALSLLVATPALAQDPVAGGTEQLALDREATTQAIIDVFNAAVAAGELPEADAANAIAALPQMSDEELAAFAVEVGVLPGADAAVDAPAGAVEIDREATITAISQALSAGVEAGEFPAADAEQALAALPNMSDEELVEYGTQIGVFGEQPAVEGEGEAAAALDPATAAALCMFEDKDQTTACIENTLETARVDARSKAAQARMDKASEKTSMALGIVLLMMLLAPLFLALPVVYRKRFGAPEQQKVLFKYSAFAAGLYLLNMLLFGLSLVLLRTFQAIGAEQTDPKLALIDGTFKTLTKHAEGLGQDFGSLFAPALNAGGDIVTGLLEHFQTLVSQAQVLINFAKRFESLQGLLENVGVLFALLAVVLFGLGFKESFVRIFKLPVTALEAREAGDEQGASRAAKEAIGFTLREMKVIGVFLGAILVVTGISGAILQASILPASEMLIGQLLVALFYLMIEGESASAGAVGLGLGSATFLVVLAVGMTLASSGIFLSRTQKLLRARFQQGVALREHWKFFVFGMLIIVAMQLYPYLYMSGINTLVEHVIEGASEAGEPPPFAFMLRGLGPMSVVGWVVLFVVAQGHKGFKFLLEYPVPKPGEEQAS